MKQFDQAADYFDLTCPACNSFFSISIFKLAWLEVDELGFTRGFFGGKRIRGMARFAVAASVPRQAAKESGEPQWRN